MNLIDTHAHLYAQEFQQDIDEVIERAKNAGVSKILLPNIDSDSISPLKKTVQKDTSLFIPMMGLHPTSVREDWKIQLDTIYKELNSYNYAGIGEIGLDLYWDQTFKTEQTTVFEEQLQWSKEKQLPVAIHSRNAIPETIKSIKKVGAGFLYGVFHSFGGTPDELNAILALQNFYVGINGVVTFKNSQLDEVLKNCSISRLLLETDAPYLAPVPYRGKRNESAYLIDVLKKLSEVYQISGEEIAKITSGNAQRLFALSSL